MTAKTLMIDIETAPSLGWVWSKWETNVIDFKKDWYLLSFAYKWTTDKKTTVLGLDDSPRYKKGSENDKWLTEQLWDLLDQADIIVGHNSDRFDLPKINTRFLTHGLKPPTPYKTVDTLKIARKIFKFDSNKLDDLARYLGIGRKLPTTGFNTWRGCMTGDSKAWEVMKRYNANDVNLLEELYYIMRPWDNRHPQVNQGETVETNCPKCGSDKIQKRGFSYTMLRKKRRYQCTGCSSWFEGSAKA